MSVLKTKIEENGAEDVFLQLSNTQLEQFQPFHISYNTVFPVILHCQDVNCIRILVSYDKINFVGS